MSAVADSATRRGRAATPSRSWSTRPSSRFRERRWASVTVLRGARFTHRGRLARRGAAGRRPPVRAGLGPCVDAVLDDNVYVTGDIRRTRDGASTAGGPTRRWGSTASSPTGSRCTTTRAPSPASTSTPTSGTPSTSRRSRVGLVLATHASLLVTAMLARDRADNLTQALESNREIGVAMGILMQSHHLTRDQAFGVLRLASQDSNRKLVGRSPPRWRTPARARPPSPRLSRRAAAAARRRALVRREVLTSRAAGTPAQAVDRRRHTERTGQPSWIPRRPLRRLPQTERAPWGTRPSRRPRTSPPPPGQEAQRVTREAKDQVSQLVGQTRSDLQSQAATQQSRAASGLRELSDQLRRWRTARTRTAWPAGSSTTSHAAPATPRRGSTSATRAASSRRCGLRPAPARRLPRHRGRGGRASPGG